MSWVYKGEVLETVPEAAIGFVYKITNKITGRSYFGKKNFFFSRTKQVKGKKKKVKVESDWKDYFSSSESLKHDVETLGKESFERVILRICHSKGELSYFEAYYQYVNHVLLDPHNYYNEFISCRIRRTHLAKLALDSSFKL